MLARFGCIAGFVAVIAAPAMAENVSVNRVAGLDAPKLSETEQAAPDWYRSFATSKPSTDAMRAWEVEPSRDVSFQWLQGGRWEVNIDMTSRSEASPLPREEVSAGATFRLTPRFSIGGQLSIGADELERNSVWDDDQVETGIRLESAFKF
ncbi:MAG: NtrZ family periplasmic regulatory protein [Pseudomonadota bacterium]